MKSREEGMRAGEGEVGEGEGIKIGREGRERMRGK